MRPGAEGMTWTEAQVRAIAQERLNQALSGFRLERLRHRRRGRRHQPGRRGRRRAAARRPDAYDLVLVSTLPHTISRWLQVDVPNRIARSTGLPVRHVEAPDRVLR